MPDLPTKRWLMASENLRGEMFCFHWNWGRLAEKPLTLEGLNTWTNWMRQTNDGS